MELQRFEDNSNGPRPGRKLGQITLRADTLQALETGLAQLRPLIATG
jgi:hypothetical protein